MNEVKRVEQSSVQCKAMGEWKLQAVERVRSECSGRSWQQGSVSRFTLLCCAESLRHTHMLLQHTAVRVHATLLLLHCCRSGYATPAPLLREKGGGGGDAFFLKETCMSPCPPTDHTHPPSLTSVNQYPLERTRQVWHLDTGLDRRGNSGQPKIRVELKGAAFKNTICWASSAPFQQGVCSGRVKMRTLQIQNKMELTKAKIVDFKGDNSKNELKFI